MTRITRLFASLLPGQHHATAREPLDHPCLSGAGHAVLDDLPLPAFAVGCDGTIRLVGER